MINVILSEFYKIFKSKVFYALSAILLGMNAITFISVLRQKLSSSPEINTQMLPTGISGYQESFAADGFLYIILIFVAFLITSEYANGSIRQMACHGIARWKLVLGQYIAMSSVITMMLLGFAVLNLLIITMLSRFGEVDLALFIRMNIGILCVFWGISGIGTFLSYICKNGGIAIAISFLSVLGGNIIVSLLNLLTKSDVFTMYSLSNMRKTIVNFTSKPEDIMKCSIVFFLIGIATILGSSLLFSKRDVD